MRISLLLSITSCALLVCVNSFAQNLGIKNIEYSNKQSIDRLEEQDLPTNSDSKNDTVDSNQATPTDFNEKSTQDDEKNSTILQNTSKSNLPKKPSSSSPNLLKSESIADILLQKNKITSLMFTDQELSYIERALDSFKNNQAFEGEKADNKNDANKNTFESDKSYIYLASIMYYSQKEWAVWINNTKITSDNNSRGKEFFVKEIYPDRAKIVWSIGLTKWQVLVGNGNENEAKAIPSVNNKNNVEVVFTLRPNQTFILASQKIIEGRVATNSTKK